MICTSEQFAILEKNIAATHARENRLERECEKAHKMLSLVLAAVGHEVHIRDVDWECPVPPEIKSVRDESGQCLVLSA